MHFLAGLEKRKALFVYSHELARSRIFARASPPLLAGKDSECTKLNPTSAHERSNDLAENCIYNVLDIALIKARISAGDTLNEFGPDH